MTAEATTLERSLTVADTASAARVPPLVRFETVQKTFDGRTLVIKNLDLEIAAGEFLTLLGPSGSGKTTTLMMLAGFEMPTHGTIMLKGARLNDVPPHRRGIGVVFQNYALFPHMSVAENVGYPLRVRRVPGAEARRRVEQALAMVQLVGYGERRPAQLSGGQQQRVALARALVFDPELILMDEPLGALDRQLREQMQLEIRHLHQRLGVTAVYVTHDQREALTMSDRIAVFNDGAVQQIDAPGALYEEPRNSFVAQFVGENNRLAGRVLRIEGGLCRVALDDGEEVTARPINVEGEGACTTLSIRPERIAIGAQGIAGDNRFPAEVLELVYLGDQTSVRLKALGRDDFMVKVAVQALAARMRPGDQITVAWDAAYCRALDPV
jgi:putative spermidine/putrescine transport system ATP-binding protein